MNSKLDREETFFLVFLTLFGTLLVSVLGQKSEKMEYGKITETKSIIFIQVNPADSETGPCGPLKEVKESANSPGLPPRGVCDFPGLAPRGSHKAVPGKATQFSH